jgi:DNA-binding CsgD family transcriptional regulator
VVVGRKEDLARAIDLVQAGISIDLVGGRGSGRTTFLDALRERLEAAEWTVVVVRGIASLRQHPLAALHLAGVGGGMRLGGNLQETAAALKTKLNRSRSVLFLDDWDDLDESSWGIAESVRRIQGVPVVLTRLQGLRARHTPTGLDASTLEPSYVIDMTPLRFEDMEKALASYLEAPIEGGTMSRIYAKSGGNVGLAISLVDATTREGQLILRQGEWVASRDLWSSGLRAVLEGYLEHLDSEARDALEIMAIVGYTSLDTVRKLIDWGTLELLEERSLVTFIESGQSPLVAVIPPLIVEFFRNEPLNARRIRLTELIVERLGTAESAIAILSEKMYYPAATPQREALFVRLLHERARTLQVVTAAEWETARMPAQAVRYVTALRHNFTSTVDATVRQIFAETDFTAGEPSERAQFHALRSRWYAYVDHDLPKAVKHLQATQEGLGVFARVLDAVEVEIRFNLQGLPENFHEKLEITDDLPDIVKTEILQTQLLVLVSTTRFSDAQRVYSKLEEIGPPSSTARVLHAMTLLGDGNHATALELLTRGLDEAHGLLDIEGVRTFGAAAILCHIYSGDNGGLDELIETVSATGAPSPFPAGNQLALMSMGALTAFRQGQVATGERLVAEIDRLGPADGPLPGQARAWGHAQQLIYTGHIPEAAAHLWESSSQLWARQARFAALTGFLIAVEIEPTQDRLTEVHQYLGLVDEPMIFQAQAQYYTAAFVQDIDGLLESAQKLQKSGRLGLAVRAFQNALSAAENKGITPVADEAITQLDRIRSLPGAIYLDAARFSTIAVTLTDREKEVAHLAAEGYSNQEIATSLVLSVRTVETHMHRIMRKLDVRSRRAIRANLNGAN